MTTVGLRSPKAANRRPFLSTTSLALVTVLVVAASAGLLAVIEARRSSGPDRTSEAPAHELDADRRRRAEMLVAIFETGMPTQNFGYTEALEDGRGLRAGWAGFSSVSGDLLLVSQRYVERRPEAALDAYLPTLLELTSSRSADTAALEGFAAAWAAAGDDPIMHEVQNSVVDELYYRPAMTHAARNGATLPLTQAALFDMMVAGRQFDDAAGLEALIGETNSSMEGTPATGVDEVSWLRRLLEVQRAQIASSTDGVSPEAMAAGLDRNDAFRRLLDQGAVQLGAPLEVEAVGKWFSFS